MKFNIIRRLSEPEARAMVKRIRVSGKNKNNQQFWTDSDNIEGEHVLVDFPISELDQDELETLESASNEERVKEYAKTPIKEPIYAFKNRRNTWFVSDGGHRVMATIMRGDKTVPAIIPMKDITENKIINFDKFYFKECEMEK